MNRREGGKQEEGSVKGTCACWEDYRRQLENKNRCFFAENKQEQVIHNTGSTKSPLSQIKGGLQKEMPLS